MYYPNLFTIEFLKRIIFFTLLCTLYSHQKNSRGLVPRNGLSDRPVRPSSPVEQARSSKSARFPTLPSQPVSLHCLHLQVLRDIWSEIFLSPTLILICCGTNRNLSLEQQEWALSVLQPFDHLRKFKRFSEGDSKFKRFSEGVRPDCVWVTLSLYLTEAEYHCYTHTPSPWSPSSLSCALSRSPCW